MAATDSEPSPTSGLPDLPWVDVVRFVRQLSHDLRNHLNAAELQSAYLGEIAADAEVKSEVKRLRGMLGELGTVLQKISSDMGHARPTLIPYPVSDLMQDLRHNVEKLEPSPVVQWKVQAGNTTVEVDPQLFFKAMSELLANAARFSKNQPVGLSASISRDNNLVISLTEPKEGFDLATENWGRQPLRCIGQGHYGLGLNRVRMIVEAHGGKFEARHDQAKGLLITTVTLPVSSKEV